MEAIPKGVHKASRTAFPVHALLHAQALPRRVFIANNGLSAVKFMRSMADFSNQVYGKNMFEFYGIATAEDLSGAYEYCSQLSDFVVGESGASHANFANIELITRAAAMFKCECVWPGWGHASESPELPAALEKAGLGFLGPSFRSMWLLGNKISSTILAQKLGISVLPYCIDDNTHRAYKDITNNILSCEMGMEEIASVATVSVERIGLRAKCLGLKFPMLVKVGRSGGGKGIYKACCEEDLDNVIGRKDLETSFFVVECIDNVRHIEIQVVCDTHGGVLVLGGRDCTTQRRHQKVIETSVSGVSSRAMRDMEGDARKLAVAAKYTGLATVEFLFDKKTHKHYFLEVNTRIQVEHTVTELLYRINLPATQYLIWLGCTISDIEKTFGVGRLKRHVLGIRINAEDPRAGLDPVTGKVVVRYDQKRHEVGYFSVYNGTIHRYSESQFGHVFVYARTRKRCIARGVRLLRNISIQYVETPLALIADFIQAPEFAHNRISTTTFEDFVAKNSVKARLRNAHNLISGAGNIQRPLQINFVGSDVEVAAEKGTRNDCNEYLPWMPRNAKIQPYLAVATVLALESLLPATPVQAIDVRFLLNSTIYNFRAHQASAGDIVLEVRSTFARVSFVRVSPTKVVLRQGSSTIVEFFKSLTSYTVFCLGEKHVAFTEFNSNCVFSPKNGKIVCVLCKDGDVVSAGDTIFEIESMKIRSAIAAPFGGVIRLSKGMSDVVAQQELLCAIENGLDNFTEFDGVLEGFVDDGSLTFNVLGGFSVPAPVWKMPDCAAGINRFLTSFLVSGACDTFCAKMMQTLQHVLARSAVEFDLGCEMIRNLRKIVLQHDTLDTESAGCISICLGALEACVSGELSMQADSTRNQMPTRVNTVGCLAVVERAKGTIALSVSGKDVYVCVDSSVYLRSDFWDALLSTVKLRRLTDVAGRNSRAVVDGTIEVIIHSGHVQLEDLSPSVFGRLQPCFVGDVAIRHLNARYEASTLRGFLETKLLVNDTLQWYRINLRSMENIEAHDTVFNKNELAWERRFCARNNTVHYKDFVELIRLYFKDRMTSCSITEVCMACTDFTGDTSTQSKGVDDALLSDFWYTYAGKRYSLSLQPTACIVGVKCLIVRYNGVQVVVIINDICYKNGSFSILEDIFFYLMTRYCRVTGSPRMFVASNSGARIGICDELIRDVEMFVRDGRKEYLVVKHFTHDSTATPLLSDKMATEHVDGRSRIISIFGNADSGPENLSFSALIAAETARAYEEIFTVSYVTGMSVGIGAYLAKLGERVIQKHDSPILLTGYKVLNRLLQSSVYMSNKEIGGFEVLGRNGTSHLEVYDDLHGIRELFWWADFHFSRCVSVSNHSVSMDASRAYSASEERLNEREVLERVFDGGVFKEYQTKWAPNVIVARGYVNSVAVGIICPEIDTQVTQVPCEPNETAPCITWTKGVMVPETTQKIAAAIEVFNSEGVDLLIVANWKGFSGSAASMFGGVLRGGSDIVRNLVNFRQRILVYIPPGGELRGGTYLVFDKKISTNISIVTHPTASIGIIQPDGLAEIKMRGTCDREFAEMYCKLHDNVYRMVRNGHIDAYVSVECLRQYVIAHFGLAQ